MAAPDLSAGSVAKMTSSGSAEGIDRPLLKVSALSEPNPTKKTRIGELSDSEGAIKTVFASEPAKLINDGAVSVGSVVRLLDFTVTKVKEKHAVMVSRMEMAEPSDAAHVQDAAPPAEEAKAEQAQAQAQEQEEGPAKKVRIMAEQDANKTSASPVAVPVKPEPTSATKPETSKENSTPPSGAKSIPKSTPGSGGARRVVPIRSLNPYNETWTIKVRISSKAPVRTFNMRNGGQGKVASMDLIDDEGTAIGATMWKDFVDKYYDNLEEGKVYLITRGGVKPADKRYASTRNDYEIHLDGRSTLEESEDQDTSKMVANLNIVGIQSLPSHVGKKALLDVMGVVVNIGEEGTVKRKSDDSELRRANVTLLDTSLKTVECTLWNTLVDTVTELRGHEAPIVTISNVRVSDYQGCSLSTVTRSSLDINPTTEAAQKLREWYDTTGRNENTSSVGEGLATTSPGRAQSTNTRETLKDISPEIAPSPTEKPTYHNVIATVAYVNPSQNFYYMAHPETNRKVVEQNGAYYCEYSNETVQTMKRRYVVSVKAMDFQSEGWLSAFNEQAEALFGCSADELAVHKEAATEEGTSKMEEVIKASQWSDWKFRVMSKSREYNGEVKLRLNVQEMSPINYQTESALLLNRIKAMKA